MQNTIPQNASLPIADSEFSVVEGLSIRLTPAPLFKRMMAYLLDLSVITAVLYGVLLLLCIMLLLLLLVLYLIGASSYGNDWPETIWLFIALGLGLMVIFFYHFYFIYFEYKRGATPGKRAFGLQVVPLRRLQLSVWQCAVRDFFRYFDCLMVVPGLLSVLVSKKHQRLGDVAGSTLVVYSKKKAQQASFSYLSAERYHGLKDYLTPRAVPPEYCRAYLRFAYPQFLGLHPQVFAEDYLKQWEAFALQYLSPKAEPMNTRALLVFFAEHCLRLLHPV